MSTVGIVGTNPQPYKFPWEKRIPIGCDLPEQGGIGGNTKPDRPLPPWVCEERNKTYNWKTGEWEYTDQRKPKGGIICYNA